MTDVDDTDLFGAVTEASREVFSRHGGDVTEDLLETMGWHELFELDPATAVAAMAEQQGRTLGRSPVLERAMMPAGIAQALDATVVLPWCRGDCGESDGEVVELAGVLASPLTIGRRLVAPLRVADERGWWSFPSETVRCDSVTGLDATAGWSRAAGCVQVSDLVQVDEVAWTMSEATGQLAVAHELVGLSARLIDLACEHVRERHQFGVPLGSLQAVQHRLTEAHVETASTRAVLATGWINRGQPEAAAALLWARRAFQRSVEECGQVMGAMGCTWEHAAHSLVRRGTLLSHVFAPHQVLGTPVWIDGLERPAVDVLEDAG